MTVETTVKKVTANGNGAATVFSYAPMTIFAATDLVVVLRSATGVETQLEEGDGVTDYIVDQTVFPGTGSIIYPADLDLGTPLAVGETLTIKRVLPILQNMDLENQGPYFPETQETAFDYGIMIDLQQQEEIDRAIKAPLSAPAGVDYTIPLPVAGAIMGVWNDDGTALEIGPTAGDISGAQAQAELAGERAAEALTHRNAASASAGQAAASAVAALASENAAEAAAASIPVASTLALRGYRMVPVYAPQFLPHPASPCAALAVKAVSGGYTAFPYLAFTDAGITEAVASVVLPPSYRGVGTIYARVVFAPKGGQEGDFRWYVRMVRVGGNSSMIVDAVSNTVQDAADVYVESTVGDLRYTSGMLAFASPGGTAATETTSLMLVVGRDPSLEANSYEDEGLFVALELYIPITDGNDQGIVP
jgi:hypothetical protein